MKMRSIFITTISGKGVGKMNKYSVSPVKHPLKKEENKSLRTVGFIFLTLIMCSLALPSVSAEGYNVLNTDSPVLELESELYSSPSGVLNVINTSDNSGNIMNSLPAENEAENVIPSTQTADVNTTSLIANLNDTILISLKENPTTGNSWNVTNSTGLAIVSDKYVMDTAPKGMVGVGGIHTWTVKAVKIGNQTFSAIMIHGSGKPTGEEATYMLNVTVKGIAKEPVEEIQSNNPTAKSSVI